MKHKPRLIGGAIGVAVLLAFAPWTGSKLGELSMLRAEHARLTAIADRPMVSSALVPAGLAVGTSDVKAAQAHVARRIQERSKKAGLLVEQIRPTAAPAPLVGVHVQLSGAENAVLAFADALEREKPMLRFRSWRVEALAGGVRLSGDLIAVAQ